MGEICIEKHIGETLENACMKCVCVGGGDMTQMVCSKTGQDGLSAFLVKS